VSKLAFRVQYREFLQREPGFGTPRGRRTVALRLSTTLAPPLARGLGCAGGLAEDVNVGVHDLRQRRVGMTTAATVG
jgi:hypothetical protein